MDKICVYNHDTYAQYQKFYKFSLFKSRNYKSLVRLPDIALGLLILANAILLSFAIVILLFFFIDFICFVIYAGYYAMLRIVPDKMCRTAAETRDSFCRYIFDDEKFTIIPGKDTPIWSGTVRQYADISKAYELEDEIYVFLLNEDQIIIEKSMFTEGTPGELRALLDRKLDSANYITVK